VACRTQKRNAHRVLVWKSEGMNHVQDLRKKRGNILNGHYISSIRILHWIHLAQESNKSRAAVNKVMNRCFPQNAGNS